jgi:hypothetical protein
MLVANRKSVPGAMNTREHSVSDNLIQQRNEYNTQDISISWWSWRPGIKPRNALLFGGLLSLLGLLLLSVGLFTMIVGIVDASSPPLQVPGTVTGHATNALDRLPHLTIRLHESGFPVISPAVSPSTSQAIHDGDPVLVDFSQHLHFLYALDHAGQYYLLPGTSASGNLPGSLALLLIGIVLLPYPALLTRWGWLDLHAHYGNAKPCTMVARVVALRSTQQTHRSNRPGLTSRFSGSWYGVALQPLNSADVDDIRTFSLRQETYQNLQKGAIVEIIFSFQLRYVYSIEERDVRD